MTIITHPDPTDPKPVIRDIIVIRKEATENGAPSVRTRVYNPETNEYIESFTKTATKCLPDPAAAGIAIAEAYSRNRFIVDKLPEWIEWRIGYYKGAPHMMLNNVIAEDHILEYGLQYLIECVAAIEAKYPQYDFVVDKPQDDACDKCREEFGLDHPSCRFCQNGTTNVRCCLPIDIAPDALEEICAAFGRHYTFPKDLVHVSLKLVLEVTDDFTFGVPTTLDTGNKKAFAEYVQQCAKEYMKDFQLDGCYAELEAVQSVTVTDATVKPNIYECE